MIRKQRDCIFKRIKELSNARVVYKGLTIFDEGGLVENPYDIPGVKEAGWHAPPVNLVRGLRSDVSSMKSELLKVLEAIEAHHASWPFLEAVNLKDVPDYLEVVKEPVDLSLIRQRLEGGITYKDKEGFKSDLVLMTLNCKAYNPPETKWYKCANDLFQFINDKIRDVSS